MKHMIYLDNAATTQPFPEVLDAMLPFFGRYYGNPSSGYELGETSKKAIEHARRQIADTLYVKPECIYFTSGGTEADNWALRFGAAQSNGRTVHLITTQVEHPAVLKTCRDLEQKGVSVTYVPVDAQGFVDLKNLEAAIRPGTAMISVMYANNEIGTIEPVNQIAALAKKRGILFHTDAVQAYGQIPIHPAASGIDLMSVSAHKLNGPKGIGFLYVRSDLKLEPMIFGGGQERQMRSGTENVPGIVGLGRAAEVSARILERKTRHEIQLRDYLIGRIFHEIPGVKLNGPKERRLPNNVNISFAGINGGALVALLDLEGICVSAASACAAGSGHPSHVLRAIGNDEAMAYGAVRFTLGWQNTRGEIDRVVEILKKTVQRLRNLG